jgi:hypothetical protein
MKNKENIYQEDLLNNWQLQTRDQKHTRKGTRTKMTREYIQKHSDNGEKGKGKTLGQKEVEQMMGTREMSDEERKQSRKKNKKEMKGPDDTHRNIT